MKKVIFIFLLAGVVAASHAQESFVIRHYAINVTVNKDASLDFSEKLLVHFTESRHGIIRSIQYQYPLQKLPAGAERADRDMEANGYGHIIIENIHVPGWKYSVNKSGDYENIKIGSADKYVDGDQVYVIEYRVLNAINFFKNHSEFYYNLIGLGWNTTIDSVDFSVKIPDGLPEAPYYFVAAGEFGSKENNTVTKWEGNTVLTGFTTRQLQPHEGLTVGIAFPNQFLIKPDYTYRGIQWLLLPVVVFFLMMFTWKKWGKDEKVTVQTEYYPPENVSPGISGYIIDDKLDRRDLTALVPYWGAGGYLQVKEIEKSSLLGIIKSKDYEFTKVKELPESAMQFEKTLFNGIFDSGYNVKLSDLKDVLYTTMNKAKSQLETEINKGEYYVRYSRGLSCFFPFLGIVSLVFGIFSLADDWHAKLWQGIALLASGIILISYGAFMAKKTRKGTELYQKLLGFKEFIKSVEKDRLQEFLKQDENYFDKVLPYAIVFDMADKWKDKLKGLDVPPPKWYSGYYAGNNFNTLLFLNSLDHSMNQMTNTFYSSPSSSSSSGGSFGGGGGFSGGGFGGGGGSSW